MVRNILNNNNNNKNDIMKNNEKKNDDPNEADTNCRLYLSNVRQPQQSKRHKLNNNSDNGNNDNKNDEKCHNIEVVDEKELLKKELTEYFEQYGTVVEVFLPDRILNKKKKKQQQKQQQEQQQKQQQQQQQQQQEELVNSASLYAFITMDTPEAAQRALADNSNNNPNDTNSNNNRTTTTESTSFVPQKRPFSQGLEEEEEQQQQHNHQQKESSSLSISLPLFESCLPAPSMRNQKQQKQTNDQNRHELHVQNLIQQSNIICQLNKSHVGRFQEYCNSIPIDHTTTKATTTNTTDQSNKDEKQHNNIVLGSIRSQSKTVMLVCLKSPVTTIATSETNHGIVVTNPQTFVETQIYKDWFVRPILHRCLVIQHCIILPFNSSTTISHQYKQQKSSSSSPLSLEAQEQIIQTIHKILQTAMVETTASAREAAATATTATATAISTDTIINNVAVTETLTQNHDNSNHNEKTPQTTAMKAPNNITSNTTTTTTNTTATTNLLSMYRIRLQIFPPKLQKPLLQLLGEKVLTKSYTTDSATAITTTTTKVALATNTSSSSTTEVSNENIFSIVQWTPKDATHTLGIMQVSDTVIVMSGLEPIRTNNDNKDCNNNNNDDNIGNNVNYSTFVVDNHDGKATTTTPTASIGGFAACRNENKKQNQTKSSHQDNPKDYICRAHWKLQEALERYKYPLPQQNHHHQEQQSQDSTSKTTFFPNDYNNSNNNTKLRALDCGAAPGGWTQFLAQTFECQAIYAVDPGSIDESVLTAYPNIVQHVPMTIQKAIPWLYDELLLQTTTNTTTTTTLNENSEFSNRPFLDIWVSDMCVKDMEQQVDLFLQAREFRGEQRNHNQTKSNNDDNANNNNNNNNNNDHNNNNNNNNQSMLTSASSLQQRPLIGSGTFFVLTLKCVIGHSDATFDILVDKQINERLQPISYNLQKLHLFTNRISERTVIGYLK